MNHPGNNHLVWLDMEMSGLNPERDRVLQIATVVTDSELNVLAEGPELVVHQPEAVINNMDEWNTSHHGQSGLIDQVRQSTLTEQEAESRTLAFLQQFVNAQQSPVCGNSVHQDRRFLRRYMPSLDAFFHYRCLDVSTLKILAALWAPSVAQGFHKDTAHTALKDVYESIEELRYYRQQFINC